jgi:hypothetical protein
MNHLRMIEGTMDIVQMMLTVKNLGNALKIFSTTRRRILIHILIMPFIYQIIYVLLKTVITPHFA